MSRVTNIIITTSISEDVDYLIQKFKEFKLNENPFNLVSVDDEALPRGWYGGSKMVEANIFLGAFNYLDLQALISFMKEQINWVNPECVQLISKEQDDFKFTLIDLFPE